MDARTIHQVVLKLVGDTFPTGDSHDDKEVLQNVKCLLDVTDFLLGTISTFVPHKNSFEGSVQDVGKAASDWLVELENQLP